MIGYGSFRAKGGRLRHIYGPLISVLGSPEGLTVFDQKHKRRIEKVSGDYPPKKLKMGE